MFYTSRRKNSSGFTLIELLVVIAIIGVLSSVVLVSLSSARPKVRNSTRNSQIKELITAFNFGIDNNDSLPSSSGTWACISQTCYGSFSVYPHNVIVDSFLAPFIGHVVDPADTTRGSGGFLYVDVYGPIVGYDGVVYPLGHYLHWLTEPPLTSDSCGLGSVVIYNANFVYCMYKLD